MKAVDYKFATKCVVKSETWFNIGGLIYLISKGSNEGYKLWNMYSKFDHKNYDEAYCYELWSDFDELMLEDFSSVSSISFSPVSSVSSISFSPLSEPEDLPNGW